METGFPGIKLLIQNQTRIGDQYQTKQKSYQYYKWLTTILLGQLKLEVFFSYKSNQVIILTSLINPKNGCFWINFSIPGNPISISGNKCLISSHHISYFLFLFCFSCIYTVFIPTLSKIIIVSLPRIFNQQKKGNQWNKIQTTQYLFSFAFLI